MVFHQLANLLKIQRWWGIIHNESYDPWHVMLRHCGQNATTDYGTNIFSVQCFGHRAAQQALVLEEAAECVEKVGGWWKSEISGPQTLQRWVMVGKSIHGSLSWMQKIKKNNISQRRCNLWATGRNHCVFCLWQHWISAVFYCIFSSTEFNYGNLKSNIHPGRISLRP